MSYIRTKEFIALIEHDGCGASCVKDNNRNWHWLNDVEKDIIKQADTIEELCDEFVVVGWKEIGKPKLSIAKDNRGIWFVNEYIQVETIFIPDLLKNKVEIYGAIWTDKGLIYVAKMNDKGELELI